MGEMVQERPKNQLARAKEALSDAVSARDTIINCDDADEARRAWIAFISAYRTATKFLNDFGKEVGRDSWAKALFTEQQQNQSLNYVFQARNADQHGLLVGYEKRTAALNIGSMVSLEGNCQNITISDCVEIVNTPNGPVERRMDGQFSTSNGFIVEGWLSTDAQVRRSSAHIQLGSLENRGQRYTPPNLQVKPEELAGKIAQVTVNWLMKKEKEASGFL